MSHPEIGLRVRTGAFDTNVHDLGQGAPALFIHGSGPGVSAWANWRLALPVLAQARRVIAPDVAGFGYTDRPPGIAYTMDTWVQQAIDLLDALDEGALSVDEVHDVALEISRLDEPGAK